MHTLPAFLADKVIRMEQAAEADRGALYRLLIPLVQATVMLWHEVEAEMRGCEADMGAAFGTDEPALLLQMPRHPQQQSHCCYSCCGLEVLGQ